MNNIYSKAVNGFKILFIMKIISRLVDFILNILVIRDIDPEIFGNCIIYYINLLIIIV